MTIQSLVLDAITFVASIVNGALGYGFSSITVPIALLVVVNRVLNPALVMIEVVLNAYVLFVNRGSLGLVWRRAMPVVLGLVPGVAIGTAILTRVDPAWLKLSTFVVLLPLILLQASGFRRPIRAERSVGAAFGVGLGVLYSITTISGPPLAIFLNNQGFAKVEFRAALGLIRFVEATLTSGAYATQGLFNAESASLLIGIIPSILIGVPIGVWLIRHVRAEMFRRMCMSFDAAIVAFATSKLLRDLHIVNGGEAYLLLVGVMLFDAALLYRFFRTPSPSAPACAQPQSPLIQPG
ncbi:MAG TPA: sulfite exporter TauE/SafE family protein [Gemmatimonadaceae bacterium]